MGNTEKFQTIASQFSPLIKLFQIGGTTLLSFETSVFSLLEFWAVKPKMKNKTSKTLAYFVKFKSFKFLIQCIFITFGIAMWIFYTVSVHDSFATSL